MKNFSDVKHSLTSVSIDKKIFYSIFLIITLSVVIIFILSSNAVGNLIFDHVSDTNQTFLVDYALRLEEHISELENLSQEILYENDFINSIKGTENKKKHIHETLNKYIYRESSLENIIFIDKTGNQYYANSNLRNRSSVYKNVVEKLKGNEGKPLWYTVESVYSHKIYMARNIFTLAGDNIGCLIFILNTEFFDNINKRLYMPYQHNIVISNNDEFIYTDMGTSAMSQDFSEKIYSDKRNTFFTIPFLKLNWQITTVIYNKTLYMPLIIWYTGALLLTLLSTVFLYIASRKISKLILTPMNKMASTINSIKNGKKTYFEYNYDDEFGEMATEFNEMIDELEKLRSNQVEEATLTKDAQLKALQAQITPHFLFNCLDIINWEAIRCNNTTISETVISLSHILSVHMGKIEHESKMSKELNYFNDYMSILTKRFGDTIHITINCDPDAYNCLVIPLTLQTLTENAWIHGMSPTRPLNIDIGIVRLDDCLVLTVFDDGKGMPQEHLEELRKKLCHNDIKKRMSGLLNLNRRIKILYGDEYGIEISSEENKFTEIEVRLPAKEW